MKYTDTLISQYDDAAFQTAFRAYFGELGCRVTNWDGLFAGMGEKGRDATWMRRDESGHVVNFVAWMNADERDYAWVRKDESGAVVGFIQFTTMDMQSWFFTVKCGFIREFWIAPAPSPSRPRHRAAQNGGGMADLAKLCLRGSHHLHRAAVLSAARIYAAPGNSGQK